MALRAFNVNLAPELRSLPHHLFIGCAYTEGRGGSCKICHQLCIVNVLHEIYLYLSCLRVFFVSVLLYAQVYFSWTYISLKGLIVVIYDKCQSNLTNM